MSFTGLRALVLLVATSAATGYAFQSSPSNRPWPPGVQPVSSESPALSPEDALKSFFMPPGYHVELVASEPMIQEPVAIDWDPQGRLWAVEMPGYMNDIAGWDEHDPIGRVVVLEDVNGDGRMDKRTVFADGLRLARSVKVLDRGVLVGEPPNAWLMHDTDGDLRMDTKELVTSRYGVFEVNPENNANGFYWALDNTMYTAGVVDINLRLRDGAFEVQKTLERGEWGVTQDDAGRIYRNTNESALHVDLVPTPYFARNPDLLRTRGSYERLATDTNELNTVWPVRPNPGTNRAYQTGIDRADGTLARFTAVCAPLVYRGDRLPAELYGNVFVAEPGANLVSRIILSDDGTTLRARKAYERGEFLASTDERFRPVDLSTGPDGTIYVVDMYRGILQHRVSLTTYLRDYILSRKLEQPVGRGRIYRVVHETTRRGSAPALATATPMQLVEALSHPNGWWRDTAQRLLVERYAQVKADKAVIPALVSLAEGAGDPRTRLHALWTLDGLDSVERTTVVKALEDSSRDVRTSAIRIAERWLPAAGDPIRVAVLQRLDDTNWAVWEQLAASLGALPPGARESAVVALLDRHADDPVAMDAALSGLRGSEADALEILLRSGEQTSRRETAITMLAATIMRGADDATIEKVFEWAGGNARANWQASALLRGAEVAMLKTPMPGTPARVVAAAAPAPCPTCPGGRAGPGGAPAFPQNTGRGTRAVAPVPPTGRAMTPGLRLNRAPLALTALAASGGELGGRATKVLARVEWPGKAGGSAPIPPLTADEQQRFERGRDVYKSVCQACHQADGRGQEKLAPSLVESTLAVARPEITTRILLNGKEGSIGLMPPVGQTFTDEQVAAVLTYVRREWGQAGTPVEPALVKQVRTLTADRARPWTNEELLALEATLPAGSPQSSTEWPSYGHDPGAQRFSPLTQITPENVGTLTRAWTFDTGGSAMQATPLVIDGVMYVPAGNNLFALEPETAKVLWKFSETDMSRRGLAYWPGDAETGARLYTGAGDGRLIAVDVKTGRLAVSFGDGGSVDLKASLSVDGGRGSYTLPSPPAVYRNVVITGGANGEGAPATGRLYGDIRGWDARTGRLLWSFHTVPRPGEAGSDTWPAGAWKNRSGTNAWGFMTVDVERGLVFAPVGSPTDDFNGADRHGNNLYGDSLVALDAETGGLKWHQQLVHHDLWDYDPAAPPALIDVRRGGTTVPAVAQITKMGLLFIFDRVTGAPVFGLEERPVPQTVVPGEYTSKTQPFPLKPPPLSRMTFDPAKDFYDLTPEQAAFCKELWERHEMFSDGPYAPMPLKGNVVTFPSTLGGGGFGGVSYNPHLGLIFLNVSNLGMVGHMELRTSSDTGETTYVKNSPVGGMYGRFWNPETRISCSAPPFGELVAVNANTGDVAWRVPLGIVENLEAKGIRNTGALNLGGSMATASGLVFIGATADRRFRAFDAGTGRELWVTTIDADAKAAPMTFQGRDGRQYVVIMAGGGLQLSKSAPAVGSNLIAFALPRGVQQPKP
jgi:glucose dehydrogenase/mono/diheme cytochrome c family protein/glucose/arabinose dehydrogenase